MGFFFFFYQKELLTRNVKIPGWCSIIDDVHVSVLCFLLITCVLLLIAGLSKYLRQVKCMISQPVVGSPITLTSFWQLSEYSVTTQQRKYLLSIQNGSVSYQEVKKTTEKNKLDQIRRFGQFKSTIRPKTASRTELGFRTSNASPVSAIRAHQTAETVRDRHIGS